MRVARPFLVALALLLALAPAASAHGDDEPNHIDTPADLKGADITRTLALAHLTSTAAPNLARYAPTTWCGTRLTTDDSDFAAFPATQRQIKVVYAYAAGEQDRSAQWSDALQANVSNIEQYLAVQTGGTRALRFDMGTECGPQYVDIQTVALPRARTYYRDDPTNFNRLATDVAAALGPLSGPRDVFVLADKLTDDPVWGIAQVIDDDSAGPANYSNAGGLTAIMWTNPSTQPDPSDPWQPTVMLHEITHNLGGVQQSAPNHTSNWHCTDGEDVMCYPDGSPEAAGYDDTVCQLNVGATAAVPQTYDCGHDDYFNPAPAPGSYLDTHWNVYRSAFMGECAQLGMACGVGVVPAPPVNTGSPTLAGAAEVGARLVGGAGTWLNAPASYALRWQRATDAGWTNIPGARGSAYLPTDADVGAALRVTVTATNADGAAIAASAPTGPVAGYGSGPATTAPAPAAPSPFARVNLAISLRDRTRHAKGTLAARIVAVAAGREVRTDAVKVAVTPGTWRLRLCAGPTKGSLRCALSKRIRTRTRSVRLPATKVLVRSPSGALKVTAALVDKRSRIRAQGSAATA
ncbi:MAG TPA: hypothetical protein VF080_17695 [Solirubrobacteraceae bacterium]